MRPNEGGTSYDSGSIMESLSNRRLSGQNGAMSVISNMPAISDTHPKAKIVNASLPASGPISRSIPRPISQQDERDNGNSGNQGLGGDRGNGDGNQDPLPGFSRREGDRTNASTSSVHQVTVNDERMKKEVNRRKTFDKWTLDFLPSASMTAAGFYLIKDDLVRCPFCKIEIMRWEKGDIPMKEHKRWSAHCPFVRGIPCGNVPIDDSGASLETDSGVSTEEQLLSYDTCGIHEEMMPFSFCDDEHPSATSAQRSALPIMKATHSGEHSGNVSEQTPELPLEKLGVRDLRAAVHPDYCSEASRLASYSSWPVAIKQRPNALAEAGFYYTGNGDQTICFHCGGGLRDWEDGDDPWIEHAKWFSKCYFVNLVKGSDFVSQVAGTRPAVMNAEEAKDLTETCPNAARQEAVSTIAAKPSQSENAACSVPSTSKDPTVMSESTSVKASKEVKDEGRLCKICYAAELGVVFLPCGHMVACVKCVPSLRVCPVCRQQFTHTVRAFIP